MARKRRGDHIVLSPELLALLRRIEESAEDGTAWLILGDWFIDHGDPAWAEFVRLRHELAGVLDDAGRRSALVDQERAFQATLTAAGRGLPDALVRLPRVRTVPGGLPVRFINPLGMVFTLVPAGRFLMGRPEPGEGMRPPPMPGEEEGGWEHIDYACPQHEVTLTRPFYLGVYAVTWGEYERLVEEAREESGCEDESPRHPAHNLCWGEALDFCEALSALPEEEAVGRAYRLPTEAEWEYACRADTITRFWTGATLTRRQATFDADRPTRVGKYPANPFGLHDMHGNVLECCADVHDAYRPGPQTDPVQQGLGDLCVFRGGSYDTPVEECASAERFADSGSHFNHDLGLRVAIDAWAAFPMRKV